MNCLSEMLNRFLDLHIAEVSSKQWVAACNIIIDKPQSIDKRIAGQILQGEEKLEILPDSVFLKDISASSTLNLEDFTSLVKSLELRSKKVCGRDENTASDEAIKDTTEEVIYRLQRMISRNEAKFPEFQRIVVISEFSAVFVPIGEKEGVPYRLYYKDQKLCLDTGAGLKDQQLAWLKTRLVPRFSSWVQDSLTNTQASLNLVHLDQYCREYSRLKEKYAGDLVRNWAESSDPEKSVHEDIGIAAYLACLWGHQKVSFVDLGCGNGLLVYILSGEGHRGVGYDLRRRGIWDWFPSHPELREQAVTPSLHTRFPDVDWILGNHSDELTPWIPVFAALSGPSTRFWVLPCCPFDFTAKYQRRNAADSVFRDYLNFVREVGGVAGFTVQEDKMRIPSTKRICLVGEPEENEGTEGYVRRVERVTEFVKGKIEGFTPREKVERVRNCTKIGSDIINEIVTSVVNICLEENNPVEKTNIKDGMESSGSLEQLGAWNAGGEFPLLAVVQKLQQQGIDFSRLKAECGGLQTLLRNHHAIFQVQQGKVKLRIPGTALPKVKNPKIKSRDCWFHLHHPDGCLLDSRICTWIHA